VFGDIATVPFVPGSETKVVYCCLTTQTPVGTRRSRGSFSVWKNERIDVHPVISRNTKIIMIFILEHLWAARIWFAPISQQTAVQCPFRWYQKAQSARPLRKYTELCSGTSLPLHKHQIGEVIALEREILQIWRSLWNSETKESLS